MSAVPGSNFAEFQYDNNTDIPKSFEIRPNNLHTYHVRLRRALHRGAPIGVSIYLKDQGRSTSIEQFDLSPSLDLISKEMARQNLLNAYRQLMEVETFELGRLQLEEMSKASICVACRLTTIG